MSNEPPAHQASDDLRPGPPGGRAETVLLADDHPAVLEVLRDALEVASFRVLAAQDGREAVELLTERPADVDLAILDLNMPHMGGLEALERMREIRPDLPALLSTGDSGSALAESRSLPDGARVLQKPISLGELLRQVREALMASRDAE